MLENVCVRECVCVCVKDVGDRVCVCKCMWVSVCLGLRTCLLEHYVRVCLLDFMRVLENVCVSENLRVLENQCVKECVCVRKYTS